MRQSNESFWTAYWGLILSLVFVFLLLSSVLISSFLKLGDKLSQNTKQSELAKRSNLKGLEDELKSLLKGDLALNSGELDELARMISEQILKNYEDSKNALKEQISSLEAQNQTLKNSLKDLEDSLDKKSKDYEALALSLKGQKQNYANIAKIVANAKIRLKDEVGLDTNTGFISLNADDVFADTSIKDKVFLENILAVYFDILLSAEIEKNIDKIIIELKVPNTDIKALKLAYGRAFLLFDFIAKFYQNPALYDKLQINPSACFDCSMSEVLLLFSDKKE